MKSGETHEEDEGDVGKVVRIPRDWFGPTDELVPFGPSASDGVEKRDRPEEQDRPADPNGFWDECSNSIQDVVEAPIAGRGFDAARDLRFPGDVRKVAVGLALVVIAGLGVAGSLLGHGRPRPARSAIASVSGLGGTSAATMRMSRRMLAANAYRADLEGRSFRRPRALHAHKSSAGHQTASIPVVYHAGESTGSSGGQASGVSATPSPTRPAETSGSTPGSGGSAASAAGPAHPSLPAFGANGALGPMTSPDG